MGKSKEEIARDYLVELRASKVKFHEQVHLSTDRLWNVEHNDLKSNFIVTQSGVTYYFDGMTKRMIKVFEGGSRLSVDFASIFCLRYNLNKLDRFTKQVVAGLATLAAAKERKPSERFCHYNKNTNTLYVSAYNGYYWKLDGKSITQQVNGTEVLFLDDDGGEHVDPDIGNHGMLRDNLVEDLHFSSERAFSHQAQKDILWTWLHAVPFGEFIGNTPLLLVEGEKGSGKTFAIKRIQKTLHGAMRPLAVDKKDPKNLFVNIQKTRIALLDNVDNFINWLPDVIANYCTNGTISYRKLYTDDEEMAFDTRSYLVVTTRNPSSFYRDDIVDRILLLRFNRLPQFGVETQMLKKIETNRAKLYGEWLYNLNEIINHLKTNNLTSNNQRLSDFRAFSEMAQIPLAISDLDGMFKAQDQERVEFLTEEDPLIDIIDMWVKGTHIEKDTQGMQHQVPNVGRTMTATELYNELFIAKGITPWGISTVNSLGLALNNKINALQARYDLERTRISGKHRYTFRKLPNE